MIFEALQSELFRFKFDSLSSKILKMPEFNLFIALVLYNDEKEVIVPQKLWMTFLDTAFNGEIRDMFPFLDKHFAWPEDLKKCSGRVSK